jgi:hypothetical protein
MSYSTKIRVYSKRDFCALYDVTMPAFEKLIEPIMTDIGWVRGKRQKFPPKSVMIVLDHLGEPS